MKTLAPAIFAVFLPLAQRTIWRDVNVVPASDADHQARQLWTSSSASGEHGS